MRAATCWTPNVSRATRAAIMLELSPLLTAAKPSERSIPALDSTLRSKPMPVTRSPLKDGRSLRNASGSWSMTATVLPRSSRMWASVEPTRPQPMITICTTRPFTVRRRVRAPLPGAPPKLCPHVGECDSTDKENLMPGIAPRAQGDHLLGGRPPVRPGAVGGVVITAASTGPEDSLSPQEDGPYQVGQDVEVTIEDVAQGGWCVARPDGLPVMFVRHALPGERVVARVTEVTSKFARADATEILEASADRVEPPCPSARPGGCGGCDWQHASLPAQRALKAAVIAQQLRRVAGLDPDREITVEPLPGDEPAESGLGWRTRVQFAVRPDGVAGLRAHRSHEVIDIGDCPIAHPALRDLGLLDHVWEGAGTVEAAVGSVGPDDPEQPDRAVILTKATRGARRGRQAQDGRPAPG